MDDEKCKIIVQGIESLPDLSKSACMRFMRLPELEAIHSFECFIRWMGITKLSATWFELQPEEKSFIRRHLLMKDNPTPPGAELKVQRL